ncbi:hypothetical protein B0T18DRAFT_168872 [Schizothecium vesticola]|uniref:Uncharacterized protein n=1 Tax=Schizothecium vesticola TaxID=314040 RepID=A0AA40ENT6_9PEZI|nr:hypothetical protein B0T18DRAFT_168872 [Schizothecium vesticola]
MPLPTTLLGLLALPLALAAPQAEPAPDPPRPWITVNAAGLPQTFTPTVLSSTTLNPPPPSLLAVATHTLLPGFPTPTSVYTGFPPVATASSGVEGAFLACTDYQSATAPFCAPMKGTVLYQGLTYYVTWSAGNLPNPPDGSVRMLEMSITWTGAGEGKDGVRAGERVPAGQGFYPWRVPRDFLSSRGVRELNVTFWLQEDAVDTVDDKDDVRLWEGPSAVIVEGSPPPPSTGEGKKGGVNIAAVVVPVVVGVLVAMAVGVCCWSWKRKGTVPVLGGLMKRRSGGGGGGAGYGVRQSRSERVGGGARGVGDDKAGGGIQLTDRESWSPTAPTAGKNVFREELQRQQRQR